MKPRDATHHLVSRQHQAETDVAATLGLVNRTHALADQFLIPFGTSKNPDAQKHDDNNEERQDGD
jgi:hypothetical protein